jgi:hypothetical protein
LQTSLEVQQAHFEIALLGGLINDVSDLLGRERLRQVIRGAAFDGVDGSIDGCIGGNDDHQQACIYREQLGNHIETVRSAQAKVEEAELIGLLS